MLEIERKWLVDNSIFIKLNAPILEAMRINQFYLIKNDNEEVRCRSVYISKSTMSKSNIRENYMTIKKNINNITREENETKISVEDYIDLRRRAITGAIEKVRYKIGLSKNIAELDIYYNLPNNPNLNTVEIEFETEEEANNFTPPDWFGREVTGEKEYSNYELAKSIK